MARKQTLTPGERSKQLQNYYKRLGHEPKVSVMHNRMKALNASTFQYWVGYKVKEKHDLCFLKNLPFDLDAEWAAKQQPICAVTGATLTFNQGKGPLAAHLDRIDPTKGYVKSNVRIVAAWFNMAKLNWSDEKIQDLLCAAVDHMRR